MTGSSNVLRKMRSEDEIREFHNLIREAIEILAKHQALMPEVIAQDMKATHDILCWVIGNENEKIELCRASMKQLVEHMKMIDAADHSATVN